MLSTRRTPLAQFWCFTLNNPVLNDLEFKDFLEEWPTRYVVFQHETGDGGTPHLQGYVEFTRRKRFTGVRTLLPRAHWEIKRGGRSEARAYCMKDDTRTDDHFPIEIGDWIPSRADDTRLSGKLTVIGEMIKEGTSLKRIASEHPAAYMRYHKGIKALQNMQSFKRENPPEVILYYGPTGSGKTRAVMDDHPDTLWTTSLGCGKWFDGFDNHEDALFDDFGGKTSHWRLLDFLQVIDR